MTRKTVLTLLLTLIFAGGTSLTAFAAHHRQCDGKKHLKRLKRQLQLSAAQQAQLSGIHDEYHPRIHRLIEKKHAKKGELKAAFQNNENDRVLKSLYKKLQSIKKDKGLLKFEKRLEIRKILTAQQRQKFDRMKHRRHHGPKGPCAEYR